MSSSAALARAVLGVLVLSTVGAFFVTQRLKREPPAIKRIVVPHYIAPRSDGYKRIARLRFTLPKSDNVTVSVVASNGDEVRRLLDDRHLDRGTHRFVWTGRNGAGRVPPDGVYFLRIVLHGQGRSVTSPRGMDLVTRPPAARILAVTPGRVEGPGARPVTVRFSGPTDPPARLTVYRTDAGPVHPVAHFAAAVGASSARWDGLVGGRPAPPGLYAFSVTVESKALLTGTWPARLPPSESGALAHTGLVVSAPALSGPLTPVAAGAATEVDLTGAPGRVTWTLTRLGARRAVARGSATAPSIPLRVPASAPSGIYALRASDAAFPLTVQGRGGAPTLVVVPALTWQALNRADSDGDGFGDTLRDSATVALGRAFAGGRLPSSLAGEVAPLLDFLDRHRLRYDITTDVALAYAPDLGRRRAVVFAGDEPWATRSLADAVATYVQGGGRVALLGAGNFTRALSIAGGRASAAGPLAPPLGERTSAASSEAAPLVVASDDAGLFAATSGYVGLFTRFEQSQSLPAGAQLLAAAGREPGHPAFVAYRLGRGLVVRAGTPQWAAALAHDSQVSDVTVRLWSLLAR